MIKYVYSIDYPLGMERDYIDWVRSIADTLQGPDELTQLASCDNVLSTPRSGSSSSRSSPWSAPRPTSSAGT
jgi:hypothetical protein